MIDFLGGVSMILLDIHLLQLILSHIRLRKEEKEIAAVEAVFDSPPTHWGKES
tara:strand:- start:903 stop:1061 length:159 start_codon:yes stop_codon:yes gene_type:complete